MSPVDLECVFMVESNSSQAYNLHRIFSNTGETPRVYPCQTGTPGPFHYFMVFQHRESARSALEIKLEPGLYLYPISTAPQLVEQFRSCVLSGLSSNHSANHNSLTAMPGIYAYNGNEAAVSNRTMRLQEHQHLRPQPSESSSRAAYSIPQMQFAPTPVNPAIFSLESKLTMNMHGKPFTFDLDSSRAQDPRTVIEFLKLSSSERGNWIIAGVHFRRTGRPHAAIEIMYSMLEFMEKKGLVENMLKPVFLLLSGCELDLAIKAKNVGDIGTSNQHYEEVQRWLQKVYGTPSRQHPLPSTCVTVSVANTVQAVPVMQGQPSLIKNSQGENIILGKRKLEDSSTQDRVVRRRGRNPRNVKNNNSVNKENHTLVTK